MDLRNFINRPPDMAPGNWMFKVLYQWDAGGTDWHAIKTEGPVSLEPNTPSKAAKGFDEAHFVGEDCATGWPSDFDLQFTPSAPPWRYSVVWYWTTGGKWKVYSEGTSWADGDLVPGCYRERWRIPGGVNGAPPAPPASPPQGFAWLGDAACEQDPASRNACKSAVISALLAAGAAPLVFSQVAQDMTDECVKQLCDSGVMPDVSAPAATAAAKAGADAAAQAAKKATPPPAPPPKSTPPIATPGKDAKPAKVLTANTPATVAGGGSAIWWWVGGLALVGIAIGLVGGVAMPEPRRRDHEE